MVADDSPPLDASASAAAASRAPAHGAPATEAEVRLPEADSPGDALPALPALLDEQGPERHPAMRVLLLLGAVVCVALGIIGWLIPVMPGFPFYILGAVLAGMASRRVAAFLNRQEQRLPRRVRLLLRPKWRRAHHEAERDASAR